MFDWLNDIVRAVMTLVPRLVLVRKTHAGVMFTRGKAKPIGPGLWCYWPVWTEVVQTPVVRQTLNLTYQSLTTKDNESVVLAVIVVYQITDPLLALTGTDNIVDTVQDVGHAGVKRVVSALDSSELQAGVTKAGKSVDAMIRRRIQADLSSLGVKVVRAFIAEMARPYFVRLMGDFTAT